MKEYLKNLKESIKWRFMEWYEKAKIWLIGFAVIVIVILSTLVWNYFDIYEITITNTEKEIITEDGSNSSRYIVHTNHGPFQNTDNPWMLKFDSADYQSKFEVGNTFKVLTFGYRAPMFSWFENIVMILD